MKMTLISYPNRKSHWHSAQEFSAITVDPLLLQQVLFDLARYHAPSTIFLDEVEALASNRESMEHEASRRLKTELLIQLDGLTHSQDQVFLLATSNLPW